MKSLHKAVALLEFLAEQDGIPRTPSEMSTATGLNAPTCVRLVSEWCRMGYAIQISRTAGYIAGPRATTLGDRKDCYARLAKAATTPLRILAEQLSCLASLSVLHQGEKYVLRHYDCDPKYEFALPISSPHLLTTASGRLLLALAETGTAVTTTDIPESWNACDDITSAQDLTDTIDAIRQQGYAEIYIPDCKKWAVARPVFFEEYPLSVVAASVYDKKLLKEAHACVQKVIASIIQELSTTRIRHDLVH